MGKGGKEVRVPYPCFNLFVCSVKILLGNSILGFIGT